MNESFYELLEVSNTASQEMIEVAYKLRMKKLTELVGNDPTAVEQLKVVTVAYENLSNLALRTAYDRRIASDKAPQVVEKLRNGSSALLPESSERGLIKTGAPRVRESTPETIQGFLKKPLVVIFLAFGFLSAVTSGVASGHPDLGLLPLIVPWVAVAYVARRKKLSELTTHVAGFVVGFVCFMISIIVTTPGASDTPTKSNGPQATSMESDPRVLFRAGAQFESDELGKLVDKHFPNAKYSPDQTIQVKFDGRSYVIQTRKLNDTGIPAVYEIVSVSPK